MITAGLFKKKFSNECSSQFLSSPFLCPSDDFVEASMLLKCVGLKKVTPVFLNYSWETDQLDIFPFLFIVDEHSINVSVSTPMVISGYHFITNRVKETYVHPELLFQPLQWNTWFVAVLGLVLCFLVTKTVAKWCNIKTLPIVKVVIYAENCFGAVLMGLYLCNLMAIVNVKLKPPDPFSSIEELTRLVENREKTLVTDSFQIMFVWLVLSGETKINDEYPESLQNLYNATRNNPSIEIPIREELCEQLMLNSSLVYIGRLSDIEEYCSQYCFWSLPIPDIPLVFRSYYVGKKSLLIEQLNLCIDFMRTYTLSMINRSKKWAITTCEHELESNLINMHFIFNAVWILLSGFVFGAIAFVTERCNDSLKSSSTYQINC